VFKISARPLADAAYAFIKRDIVRCLLEPDRDVSESQLARRYRLGKAPVRAALLCLRQEGLVRAIPRRGYQISPVTLKDAHDIFELRLLVEPAAARLAAGRVDTGRLRRLDRLCRAGYTLGNRASASAFLRANRDFHVTIARATDNGRLAETLSRLLDEMERLFHLGLALRNRTAEMQHEHRQLVDALVAGDGKAAERVAAEQIEAARKMVMDAIFASPQIMRVTLTGHELVPAAARGARLSLTS
jgi:DNA-binding GntR family transcriptional regulator